MKWIKAMPGEPPGPGFYRVQFEHVLPPRKAVIKVFPDNPLQNAAWRSMAESGEAFYWPKAIDWPVDDTTQIDAMVRSLPAAAHDL